MERGRPALGCPSSVFIGPRFHIDRAGGSKLGGGGVEDPAGHAAGHGAEGVETFAGAREPAWLDQHNHEALIAGIGIVTDDHGAGEHTVGAGDGLDDEGTAFEGLQERGRRRRARRVADQRPCGRRSSLRLDPSLHRSRPRMGGCPDTVPRGRCVTSARVWSVPQSTGSAPGLLTSSRESPAPPRRRRPEGRVLGVFPASLRASRARRAGRAGSRRRRPRWPRRPRGP